MASCVTIFSDKHMRPRQMLCRNCGVKVGNNGVNLTPRLLKMYSEFFSDNVDQLCCMLPTVICKTSAIWLEKKNKSLSAGNIPIPFSWTLPIKNTRLSTCCVDSSCTMCQEAYRFGPKKRAPSKFDISLLVGR